MTADSDFPADVDARDTATHVGPADTATHVDARDTATHVGPADTATHVGPADTATHVGPADTATHVGSADTATHVGSADTAATRHRAVPWRGVRAEGEHPDYRFSLANERTFLAWVRTGLGLSAGGMAAVSLLDDLRGATAIGLVLLALSAAVSATSFRRWVVVERSIRLAEPLPPSPLPLILASGTTLVAVAAAIAAL